MCSIFFYVNMSIRKHKNNKQDLINDIVESNHDNQSIHIEAITYNIELCNSREAFLSTYPQTNYRQTTNERGKEYFSKIVTNKEARRATFSIVDSKSHKPDGYMAIFFKIHWDDFLDD